MSWVSRREPCDRAALGLQKNSPATRLLWMLSACTNLKPDATFPPTVQGYTPLIEALKIKELDLLLVK